MIKSLPDVGSHEISLKVVKALSKYRNADEQKKSESSGDDKLKDLRTVWTATQATLDTFKGAFTCI